MSPNAEINHHEEASLPELILMLALLPLMILMHIAEGIYQLLFEKPGRG